jgi:hypothetical protein
MLRLLFEFLITAKQSLAVFKLFGKVVQLVPFQDSVAPVLHGPVILANHQMLMLLFEFLQPAKAALAVFKPPVGLNSKKFHSNFSVAVNVGPEYILQMLKQLFGFLNHLRPNLLCSSPVD